MATKLFFTTIPHGALQEGPMLARETGGIGLEIGVRCHYHSGLERSPRLGPCPQNVENIVIIKTRTALIATLLLIAGASLPAFAAGDVVRGEKLGYTCLGCHGIEGYRNAYPSYRVPKLGGQKAAYLVAALKGYREGARAHTTMAGQASSLTDQQIEDLAAYLASRGGETVAAGGSSAPSLEATTTCIACHGQNGISLSPTWPTLAGQHEDYLVHALNQYRNGERTDAVMAPMAAALSDDDVALLAKFYSRLDGLQTTKVE
jgi:cytochrome c553